MENNSIYLKWADNEHLANTLSKFKSYMDNEAMVDVTIVCEGLTLKAHKIVLASVSTYFQALFLEHTAQHPVIILKDVKFSEMQKILDFIYNGEVNIPHDQVASVVSSAKSLNVTVLGDVEVLTVDQSLDDSVSGPHPTEASMFPPEQINNGSENQEIINQGSMPVSEQGLLNIIPDLLIKRSDSDVEDFNDMDSSAFFTSTIVTVPLETHGSNAAFQSQIEQPVEQGAYTSLLSKSLADSPSSLTEQTFTDHVSIYFKL